MDVYTRSIRKDEVELSDPKPFNIGFIIPDDSIGVDETLCRILEAIDGQRHSGGLGDAKCVTFYPAKHTATQFSPHLDAVKWIDCYRNICRMRLAPLCECDGSCCCNYQSCEFCDSDDRYAALDAHGQTVAIICGSCGNADGLTWLLYTATDWPRKASRSAIATERPTLRC